MFCNRSQSIACLLYIYEKNSFFARLEEKQFFKVYVNETKHKRMLKSEQNKATRLIITISDADLLENQTNPTWSVSVITHVCGLDVKTDESSESNAKSTAICKNNGNDESK